MSQLVELDLLFKLQLRTEMEKRGIYTFPEVTCAKMNATSEAGFRTLLADSTFPAYKRYATHHTLYKNAKELHVYFRILFQSI